MNIIDSSKLLEYISKEKEIDLDDEYEKKDRELRKKYYLKKQKREEEILKNIKDNL